MADEHVSIDEQADLRTTDNDRHILLNRCQACAFSIFKMCATSSRMLALILCTIHYRLPRSTNRTRSTLEWRTVTSRTPGTSTVTGKAQEHIRLRTQVIDARHVREMNDIAATTHTPEYEVKDIDKSCHTWIESIVKKGCREAHPTSQCSVRSGGCFESALSCSADAFLHNTASSLRHISRTCGSTYVRLCHGVKVETQLTYIIFFTTGLARVLVCVLLSDATEI